MDKALAEGYLGARLQFDFEKNELGVIAVVEGKPYKPRSRVTRPPIIVGYCPFCGRKLISDPKMPKGTEDWWNERQV